MSDSKFFDKTIVPACKYCEHCREVNGGKEFFCIKRGFTEADGSCRSYKYDILKREPRSIGIPRKYNKEDFVI